MCACSDRAIAIYSSVLRKGTKSCCDVAVAVRILSVSMLVLVGRANEKPWGAAGEYRYTDCYRDTGIPIEIQNLLRGTV